MRKKNSYRHHIYVIFALIILIGSWELNFHSSTILASSIGSEAERESEADIIPQESIRLRILANSDSPADQWIKREVRDAIIEEMQQWVTEPDGMEAARAAVRAHLPELRTVVGSTLGQYGFTNPYQVELGLVPFPAKMYGSQIYPAGDYEALRVSIGAAEGQNWWCVLFPPLCFVDSEVIAKPAKELAADVVSSPAKAGQKSAAVIPADGKSSLSDKRVLAKNEAVQPEIHFFLWDLLKKWFA
ncbi:stage II sporulation protein R [Paenibacillus sp. 1_12]|uniref:stage II sporulation protein R n=1 Tax=Paenibacillus sp. 1_12 TaxID=1566278 RepID=UPI0008E2B6C9|nr:stage II sporulation protein R [Paenibacillus sp. 1_12]SFL87653.1 stage II sporulation protein R [Paenibacillus sp. 1_12]